MVKNVFAGKRRRGLGADLGDVYYLAIHPRITHLRKFFAGKKGILLDIGCGEMPFKRFIMEYSEIDTYLGCDIAQNRDGTVNILIDSAVKLPLEDGSIDVVFINSVLEHTTEPFDVIKEATRVLKRGGSIYCYVPFIWQEHEQPWDYYRFTQFGLGYIFKKADLININIHTAGGFYSVIGMMFVAFMANNKKIGFLGKGIFLFISSPIGRPLYNIFFESLDRWLGTDNPTIGFGISGCKA